MTKRRNSGFTLLELAIVITIIAIIIALATTGLKAQLQMTVITSTQDKISTIKTALENYKKSTGHYPCPTPPSVSSESASYGIASTECRTSCPAGMTCVANATNATWTDLAIGSLPFKTLGLPKELSMDGYDAKISYAVDSKLTMSNDFCTLDGSITVQDYNNNLISDKAAYVIVSHGEDTKGGYNSTSGALLAACDTAAKDGENCDNDMVFRLSELNTNATSTNYYDDIIAFGNNTDAKYCPAGLTNCQVWYDPAEKCSVITDTGGVVRMYDKSSSKLFAYQNTSTNRPDYTKSIAGKPVATFTGGNTDALYTNLSTNPLNSDNFTFVTVFSTSGSTTRLSTLADSASYSAVTSDRTHRKNVANTIRSSILNGTLETANSGIGFNTADSHIAITTVGPTNAHRIFLDGILMDQGSYTSSSFTGHNTLILGSHAAQANFDLLEYIYLDKELSADERKALELYLANKWGVNY